MAGPYDKAHHELRSEQGGWRFRDIAFLLITLGIAATIATVVIGTTVIGGGGFLLLISPLLLLFSPILVPAAIIFTILGGGAIALTLAAGSTIGGILWLYNYFTGGRPVGAEQVDRVAGGVKGIASYAKDTVGSTTHKMYETVAGGATETAGKAAGGLMGDVGSGVQAGAQRTGQRMSGTG